MIPTTQSSVTEPNGLPPNPFEVPDLPQQSLRPLMPWLYREHGAYYVPVDDTQAGYQRFEGFLRKPLQDLTRGGRLVVVTGGSGCGKTSLIHRCVDYVQREINPAMCAVVDLSTTMEAMGPDADSAAEPEQIRGYLDRLAHMVMTQLAEEHADFEEPGTAVRPANSAYAKTSAQLKKINGVAVIILPPFEDAVVAPQAPGGGPARHPVRHYMNFRHPRMIFFAECLNTDGVTRWHDHISSMAAKEDVLLLRVGPLRRIDRWIFAASRLQQCPHPGVPRVSEETMLEGISDDNPMSLSQLQMLCHTVWDDVRHRPGTSEVTPEDIRRYYTSQNDNLQPRSPSSRIGQP